MPRLVLTRPEPWLFRRTPGQGIATGGNRHDGNLRSLFVGVATLSPGTRLDQENPPGRQSFGTGRISTISS